MFRQSMDRRTASRLGLALSMSLVAHGALLVIVQVQPGAGPGFPASAPLHARIEVQSGNGRAPGLEHSTPVVEAPSEPARTAAAFDSKEAVSPPAVLPEHARSEPVAAKAGTVGAAAPPTVDTGSLHTPLARDPTYYAVSSLDVPPRLLGPADACYPHGATGEVAYVLLIDDTGKVDQVTVAAAQPEGLFTGAAAELCGQLAFVPGMRNGRPVRSRVRFVVGPTPP